MNLTLVLGGMRSGKSRYAEALIEKLPPPWIYIATGRACDAEMSERIARHRALRRCEWETIEASHDLSAALISPRPVLVDSLGFWVSTLMHENRDINQQSAQLLLALEMREAPTVIVSDEVGLGGVPENRLARRFNDALGALHQRIAERAQKVYFVVAGCILEVK